MQTRAGDVEGALAPEEQLMVLRARVRRTGHHVGEAQRRAVGGALGGTLLLLFLAWLAGYGGSLWALGFVLFVPCAVLTFLGLTRQPRRDVRALQRELRDLPAEQATGVLMPLLAEDAHLTRDLAGGLIHDLATFSPTEVSPAVAPGGQGIEVSAAEAP